MFKNDLLALNRHLNMHGNAMPGAAAAMASLSLCLFSLFMSPPQCDRVVLRPCDSATMRFATMRFCDHAVLRPTMRRTFPYVTQCLFKAARSLVLVL